MEKKKVEMFGIKIDNLTMKETVQRIDELILQNKNAYVVTPNVDHIVKIKEDPLFYEIYKNADLVLADGMPIIWSSKILKKPLKEKVSGSDLLPEICELAAQREYGIFILGAAEGVATKCAVILEEKYKGLKVLGTYSPPFGFEKNETECKKIISLIKESKSHILCLALGTPKQEKWAYKYRNEYNVPISLGIGAAVDFMVGEVKRAPKWMQSCGLEWFYRFCQEPKRMYMRYFVDDRKFIGIFLKEYKQNK